MPRKLKVIPIKVMVRREERWRVIVPKELRGVSGQRCIFYRQEGEAVEKCRELMRNRSQAGIALYQLSQDDRVLVLAALRRCNGDANQLLSATEGHNAAVILRSVHEAVTECIAAKKGAGLRPRSITALNSSLGMFAAKFGDLGIRAVTSEMVDKWLTTGGWAAATRRGYLTDVRTLFSFAVARGYAESNPAEAVQKPILEDRPPGIFTVNEVSRLLKTCLKVDRGLLGYIAPILFGGFRPDESRALNKKQVGKDLIEVTPQSSKTRRRRFIPINSTLKAWLAGAEYGIKNPKRRLDKVRRLAKVPWPHDVLRHTFCSYALPKHGATLTAAWAGHSEQVLFQHYRERVKPKEVEKFWALRPK